MSLPLDDFARKIYFEIHDGLSRQGPGSIESSLRALRSIDPGNNQLNILDIARSPGKATIELARLGYHVTAIDNYEPFLKMLLRRVKKEHVSDRITASLGDMFCLEKIVGLNRFDVIWSEGAIYIISFEYGLTKWQRFLKKDGYLVCSELLWLTSDSSSEVREF